MFVLQKVSEKVGGAEGTKLDEDFTEMEKARLNSARHSSLWPCVAWKACIITVSRERNIVLQQTWAHVLNPPLPPVFYWTQHGYFSPLANLLTCSTVWPRLTKLYSEAQLRNDSLCIDPKYFLMNSSKKMPHRLFVLLFCFIIVHSWLTETSHQGGFHTF